jgi:putative SOS response-associated peptidase YedK
MYISKQDILPKMSFYRQLHLAWEVFPSQQLLAIIMHEPKIRLGHLTWGLDTILGQKEKRTEHINVSMENLDQKPSFRESFRKRQCLIIANGFYEWQADPENGNKKIRYYQLPSRKPFAFTGLWDSWQKDYQGCTFITSDAVGQVRDIHDRMPCVLKPEVYVDWLDLGDREIRALSEFLKTSFFEFIKSET